MQNIRSYSSFSILDNNENIIAGLSNLPANHAQIVMLSPYIPISTLMRGQACAASSKDGRVWIRREK